MLLVTKWISGHAVAAVDDAGWRGSQMRHEMTRRMTVRLDAQLRRRAEKQNDQDTFRKGLLL